MVDGARRDGLSCECQELSRLAYIVLTRGPQVKKPDTIARIGFICKYLEKRVIFIGGDAGN